MRVYTGVRAKVTTTLQILLATRGLVNKQLTKESFDSLFCCGDGAISVVGC